MNHLTEITTFPVETTDKNHLMSTRIKQCKSLDEVKWIFGKEGIILDDAMIVNSACGNNWDDFAEKLVRDYY